MFAMAGLRRLHIAFSHNCSVSGSLPSLSFPLVAGESGDLGVLEVQEGPWCLSVPPSQVSAIHFTGIYGALAVPGIRAKFHCSGVDAWLRKTSQWLNRYLHYDLRLGSLEFLYPREENRQAMLVVRIWIWKLETFVPAVGCY